MGETTEISWTNHTFSPWHGCTKVKGSRACQNCYAEAQAKRFGTQWGIQAERRFFGDKHWNEPLKWDRKASAAGVRRKVFCASMSDVFEGRTDLDDHRKRLWKLIEDTPNLDWLLLTKRPENVLRMVPDSWVNGFSLSAVEGFPELKGVGSWPENVWIGTTVEDQRWADERIPHLADIPAKYKFLSCEPLMEHVDLRLGDTDISWVIVGGESGPKARPMHPNWARSLRDQCLAEGVAFFMKQWGAWMPLPEWKDSRATHSIQEHSGHVCTIAPMGERTFADPSWAPIVKVGKGASGSLLDGVNWKQFPDQSETVVSIRIV